MHSMLNNVRPHHHGFPKVIHDFPKGWAFLHAQRSQSRLSKNSQPPLYGKAPKKGHSDIISQFHAIKAFEDAS
jgi:hypothetical protein